MISLKDCIQSVGKILTQFQIDSLLPQIKACAEAVQDGNTVDVVVVGRFKAGKSSFINSIIGQNIIPVGVLPATAVVTRIYHGPEDRVLVHYISCSLEEIPLERLAEFVTEERNPNNEKQVAVVDVELACLEPYRGIRFVDTPGLGSVYTHNTKTSMDWLPKVGAAIITVSVDHPLSEQDVHLLQDVMTHTPEVAILLTKVDLVTEEQTVDVVAFIQKQTAKHLGKELRIFPFSTKHGFNHLRQSIMMDYLIRHISDRREEEFKHILNYKIRSLIAGCKEYLRLAQQAATAAEDARLELQKQLQQEKGAFNEVQNEIRLLAIDMKTRMRSAATEQFRTFYPAVALRLRGSLREAMSTWRGNLRDITVEFQRWLNVSLEKEMQQISHNESGRLLEWLPSAISSFSRIVRAFQDRLSSGIERALHISFAGAHFEANVLQPVRPDIRIDRVFDTPFDLIWFLIPMGLLRPLVNRYFLNSIPWEVEKNLSRLAVQWADAVCNSIEELAQQSRDFINNEINTIESLVLNVDNRRTEIQKAFTELESFETMLS